MSKATAKVSATHQIHLLGSKATKTLALNAAATQAHAASCEKAKVEGAAAPATPKLAEVKLDGFSGRAVRLRVLDPDEREQIAETAAKLLGPEATMGEYHRKRARDALNRVLVEVTEPCTMPADLAKARWSPVNQMELEGGGDAKRSFGKLFTAKDRDVLTAWYQANHDATMDDVEAITGGAIEIAE